MRPVVPFLGQLEFHEPDPASAFIEQAQRRLEESGVLLPRPWCRLCHAPVETWTWLRDNDDWILRARCHGEQMSCSVSHLWPIHQTRLELFCENEPRMHEQSIWWVNWDGSEIQASKAYIQHAVSRGGIGLSPFGFWIRKNAAQIALSLLCPPLFLLGMAGARVRFELLRTRRL
jgi:hypothetical protein